MLRFSLALFAGVMAVSVAQAVEPPTFTVTNRMATAEPITATIPPRFAAFTQDCPNGRCPVNTSATPPTTMAPPQVTEATPQTTDGSPAPRTRRTPLRSAVRGTIGNTITTIGVGLEAWGIALQEIGRVLPFAPLRARLPLLVVGK